VPGADRMSAPELADWLESLTDEQRAALVADIAAASPPGLVDQLAAATTQARAAITRLGGQDGTTDDLPDPIVVSVLDLIIRWATGKAQLCVHHPDLRRPQPVLAAGWGNSRGTWWSNRPNRQTDCPHLLRQPRGSDANYRCDLCGTVDREHLSTTTVAWAGMLYGFATCQHCAAQHA
jgi:hypothetical protein